ncbi:hypothetical protein V1264_010845 [Littorina saxatilis]|uniref:Uncharacterized protein n=2 Tax=Littorina saxatilis TaxID=31220 RepID=A0AAN9BT84_9CAEN
MVCHNKVYLAVSQTSVLLMLLLASVVKGDTFLLEAEEYVTDRMAFPRTTASGIWSVHFYQNEVFPLEFCVQSDTTITVSNIRYSNDGGEDFVDVTLDGQKLGTLTSLRKTSPLDEWNEFEDSGEIGGAVAVLAGKHKLELAFPSTDRYGIEIDFVAIHIADEGQDERLLKCTAYCDDSINYKPTLVSDTLPSGYLQQRSRRTACAEERNVKVEVHHPGLGSYRLTAHSPLYHTLLDSRQEDFMGCQGSGKGKVVWLFNNFDLITSAENMQYQDKITLAFSGNEFARNTQLIVNFATVALTSTLPGAVLRLKFRRTSPDVGIVHVILAVNGSHSVPVQKATDPSTDDNEVSWDVDPDVLTSGGDVELVLTVVHDISHTLHAEYLRLDVLPSGEEAREVYRDNQTVIQAVTRLPAGLGGGMILFRPDNGASWYETHAITVLKRLSWAEDFEEIFRLDQDGTVRLKPQSLYASRSPPYGTSVVVGPSDPFAAEPAAPVYKVDIDPWAQKLTVTYKDLSLSEVLVRTGSYGVRAIVNHKRWVPSSLGWPVAVVTSMWVADGKSDVDHVSANGAEPRGVVADDWQKLYGTSFAFFRQCVSRHNTQAPDVMMELLEPHSTLYS